MQPNIATNLLISLSGRELYHGLKITSQIVLILALAN